MTRTAGLKSLWIALYLALAASTGAALAACGGSSEIAPQAMPQSVSPAHAMAQWQRMRAAQPACPDARPGEAQCLALIQSRSGIGPTVAGWTPSVIQTRYKLPSTTKGTGQIVAIVDAFDNPNVASDLAAYRSEFGLGTANFSKYNQLGQQKNYPKGNSGWGVEIDLDVEMVSASCPLCTIYLIEANGAYGSDLEAAEAEAVTLGAHIVTNSWICYGSVSCVGQSFFDTPGVEYLAAAGDSGQGQEGAPMAFATVASIGGTQITQCGSSYCENPWSGSGGGCVTSIKKPRWQHDTVCAGRATNDAAAVSWDLAVYDSYGYSGWFTVGGTSAASPLLAGVFGLAGNATEQVGGRTFWLRKHRRHLYDLCDGSCLFSSYSYGTGWGSPDGIRAF